MKAESVTELIDIRQQLNTVSSRMKLAINCGKISTQFDACADGLSWTRETEPTDPYAFAWGHQTLTTDRVLERPMDISSRSGEILAKPERLNAVMFKVPGNVTTKANLIVGGRKQSQGKYVLRVRVKDFE